MEFVVFLQTNGLSGTHVIQAGLQKEKMVSLKAIAERLVLLIVKDRNFARARVTTAVCTSTVLVQ